jgi:ubiquinone/menaquinone biosynthesis C-methylase UbiE
MKTEVARLRQQALMWFPRERAAFARAGLGAHPGQQVADIGCGPGFLSREVLAAFPGAAVSGVELDPALLKVAQATNAGAGGRFAGYHGSIDALPLKDASMDFVLVRYVVQHLPEPVRALREVLRVLRPGGRLIVMDIDEQLTGIFAPGPKFQAEYALENSPLQAGMAANRVVSSLFDSTQKAEGGDRNIGRRLWGLMETAGFSKLQLSTEMIGSPELGLPAFKKLMTPDARAWKFFRKGKLSKAQLDANEGMLAAFFADPASLVYDLEWIIVGTKPGRPAPQHKLQSVATISKK